MNLHQVDEKYSHLHDRKVHFLTTKNRKGKYRSRQSIKKHKKSISLVTEPPSSVAEYMSPVREQRGEDHSPLRVTFK